MITVMNTRILYKVVCFIASVNIKMLKGMSASQGQFTIQRFIFHYSYASVIKSFNQAGHNEIYNVL